jgi:predicted nucleic acid-binding protein
MHQRGRILSMKPSVYVETTIPSYLTAWPSRDLVRTAHQQVTREWWTRRDRFELYSSRLVIQECQRGDVQAAADRLATMAGIPLLEQGADIADLAAALLRDVPLPERAAADALHIATAAVHGMQYLLTWNCTHIANAALRPQIEAVCRAAGFEPPLICTPEELPEEGLSHD